jgi:hypothetical protein
MEVVHELTPWLAITRLFGAAAHIPVAPAPPPRILRRHDAAGRAATPM